MKIIDLFLSNKKKSKEKIADESEGQKASLEVCLNELIQEGGFVDISIKGNSNKYYSRIENIVEEGNDKFLIITALTSNIKKEILLKKTEILTISYKLKYDVFAFNSKYIGEYNHIKLLKIQYPDEIIPIQKRQFLRVKPSIDHPIKVSFTVGSQKIETYAVDDISENGIAFRFKEKIAFKDDLIDDFHITLPDSNDIIICAEVRHTQKIAHMVKYGLEFFSISETDQDKVFTFVSKRMGEIKNKYHGRRQAENKETNSDKE